MPIKNYTTEIDCFRSIGEIQGILAAHGASKIMIDYSEGVPQAVTFALSTPSGICGFKLPATIDGTFRAFERQKVKADRKQAEKTAWRNVRDWVFAQMALTESCDMPVDEVFLPYLTDANGGTLYEAYISGRLALHE